MVAGAVGQATMSTGVPEGARSATRSQVLLSMRTQPWLTVPPMRAGLLVPCRAISPTPEPKVWYTSEKPATLSWPAP